MHKILILIVTSLFSLGSAQLPTINENFSSFNQILPFPHNGWTIATVHSSAITIGYSNTTGNQFIQANGLSALCCSSVNIPQYLFTPQIVAPDGTKTLSFEVHLSSQFSTATTVEVGLVSNPSDVSTFTSIGVPVTVQTTTPITISYIVPNSTKQYLVFKFISPSNNSQTIMDNVVYGGNLSVADSSIHNNANFIVKDNILLFLNKEKISHLKIYNAAGQIVLKSGNSNTFDISSLHTGIYTFQAVTDKKTKYISKFRK